MPFRWPSALSGLGWFTPVAGCIRVCRKIVPLVWKHLRHEILRRGFAQFARKRQVARDRLHREVTSRHAIEREAPVGPSPNEERMPDDDQRRLGA